MLWTARRQAISWFLSAIAWAVTALCCLMIGSTGIGFPDMSQPEVLGFRLSAVLVASLVGAGLAGSGLAYQAVLRNPLADPYLLGVSGGATLATFVLRYPARALTWPDAVVSGGVQAAAFFGAMVAVVICLALGREKSGAGGGRLSPTGLILVGVIISTMCGAILQFMLAIWPEAGALTGGAMAFLLGGLQPDVPSWAFWTAFAVIAISVAGMMALSGRFTVLSAGPSAAKTMGVPVEPTRWWGLILGSAMAAAAVSISGPIGFIGLIAPHIARMAVGPDYRKLLAPTVACGAILLCWADALSRGLSAQGALRVTLPVGVLTACLGGPFFVLIRMRQRRGQSGAGVGVGGGGGADE